MLGKETKAKTASIKKEGKEKKKERDLIVNNSPLLRGN